MLLRKIRSTLLPVLILSLFPALLVAQSADKGLTPLQVAQIQQVSEASISPSGTKVAYTINKPADPLKENKKAKNYLFLLDLNSGNSVPFIKTMDVSDIAFRPGKKTITFLGKRENDETNA